MKWVQYKQRIDSGFTIVELLVVIVVIAILAAIVIVSYNGITRSAHESVVMTEARQVGTIAATYHVDEGVYPSDVGTVGAKVGADRTLTYSVSPDGQKFCGAVSEGDISYKVTGSHLSPQEGTCEWTVSGFVGSGVSGFADGSGTGARFGTIYGLTFDTSGTMYVADRDSNNCMRKVTPGGVVTTFAGLCGTSGYVDGTGTAARLYGLVGVSADSSGTIWFADYYNHCIRRVTSAAVVTRLASTCNAGTNTGTVDGTGTAARFYGPYGIVATSTSTAFVTDRENHCVRKVTSAGVVTTFAGLCGAASAYTNGTGTAARFGQIEGITADASGNLYIADDYNHCVRKVTPSQVVTTYAGVCGTAGVIDGPASTARLTSPAGLAIDSQGTLYIVGRDNLVRSVSSDGIVTTLAGTGAAGSVDGQAMSAQFNGLRAVAVGSDGTLYVGGASEYRIRKITPPY